MEAVIMKYRIDIWRKVRNAEGREYNDWVEYIRTNVKNPAKKAEKRILELSDNHWKGYKKDDLSFTVKELEPWTKEELRKQLLY
jgi:hypothetical protein